MATRVAWAACLALVAGCASAGGSGNAAAAPVPLYTSADAVPCDFEVMRTLRRTTNEMPRSTPDYERIRRQILGRAGAEIGADAVLVAPAEEEMTGTQRRAVGVPGTPRPIPSLTLEGQAIRFTDETCG